MKFQFKLMVIGVLIAVSFLQVNGQFNNFHILYKTPHFTHCYDVAPTLDQGYIITGFEDRPAPFNMPLVPYLSKINCMGEVEWIRKYGQTNGIDNSDPRVGILKNGNYVMMSTAVENSFDILLVVTDENGNSLWKNTYGGDNEDIGRGMTILSDDNIIVCGNTESFGSDADTPYTDMYAVKVNSETGDTIWTKTMGNRNGLDQLWDVVESDNGDLNFLGRTFHDNLLWLSLIRTDKDGNYLWSKLYGKTNHQTSGFDIIKLRNGNFAFTGITTAAKFDFNALVDIPVFVVDNQGNIVWSKIYRGDNPDLSDLASTIIEKGDSFIIAMESTSYPQIDADLTKRMLLVVESIDGDVVNAKSFNGSGGQFARIKKDHTGFILSSMTDEFEGSWNDPMLIKLNDELDSGCEELDWTPETVAEDFVWDVVTGQFSITSGADINIYTVDSTARSSYRDSTICFSGSIPATCELISSLEETESTSMSVWPNPVSD